MCKLRHRRRVWYLWLGATVGAFAAAEYPAVRYECHDPLSAVLHDLKLGIPIAIGGMILGVHCVKYKHKPNSLAKEKP